MLALMIALSAHAGPLSDGPQLAPDTAGATEDLRQKHHVGPWVDSLTEDERSTATSVIAEAVSAARAVEGDGQARLEALALVSEDRDGDLAELGGTDAWLRAFPASEVDLYVEDDRTDGERCAHAKVLAEQAEDRLTGMLRQLEHLEHQPARRTKNAMERTLTLTQRFSSDLQQSPETAIDAGARAAQVAFIASTRLLGDVLGADKGALRATTQLTPELTWVLTQAALDAGSCTAPEAPAEDGEQLSISEDVLR